MKAHDPTLRQLNQQFRNARSEMSLQVRVFAETQDVTLTRRFLGIPLRTVGVRVVDPSSSDPGLEGVTATPMAGDHFSICKPRGRQDHIHKSLCDFIDGVVNAVQRPAAALADLHLPPQLTVLSAQVDVSRLTATRESAVLIGPQDARLQPAEGRFFGRDEEVAQLLAFLRSSGDAVVVTAKEISGVGGIGKTEVCKAALKAWLGDRPAEAAYFLTLPDGAGLGELLGRLASGVGLAQADSVEQVLATLPNGLYYLDNLESVAAMDEGRAALRALRSRQGIRLLVSSRLSLPGVLGPSIEIGVLPRDAALRLFREAWLGHDALAADAELEKFVIGELGAHALSVGLCARLGDAFPYTELVRRWREQGARLLHDPQDRTRLGSLPVSLALTAKVLGREPTSLHLWSVSALFYGGLPEQELGRLEALAGWPDARLNLVRHHVLARRADGMWTMLPPLARYAQDSAIRRADGFDWSVSRVPLQALFLAIAREADSTQSSDNSLRARAWLIQNFGTLDRLMRLELEYEFRDIDWLAAMDNGLANTYQFQAPASAELLRAMVPHLPRPARATKKLGDLERRLGRVDEARGLYDRALALFEKEQDGLGQANTLKALGDLESRLDRVDEARGLYDRALALYEKEQVGLGQANTLQSIGDAARLAGRYAEAAAIYQRALVLYAREQDPMGSAYTFVELSRCLHALREEVNRDAALERALQWAGRTNNDSVLRYVQAALVEVTGGREQAEAWMSSRMR